MYRVRTLGADAAEAAAWDAFVAAHPQASFFHLSGWKKVIERGLGASCRFLYAERAGAIEGVLPLVDVRSALFGHRLVSTGWGVGGGAVATAPAAMATLDAAAEQLLRRCGAAYIELRDPAQHHDGGGWVRREGLYAGFAGPIAADEDANLKQVPRKQRAVIRKALDGDLEDRADTGLDAFWTLYSLSMRNLGTPVFPRGYLAALREVFGESCDVVTIYRGRQPLASVLNFHFRDRVLPYYTGAHPDARQVGAADLMYFRVMRRAVARGCTTFDFGRSKVGSGPYAFKKNWGFVPRPIIHEFLSRDGRPMPDINPNNPKFRLMIAAWRRLPLPLANLLGPWIGRQVG